MTVIIIPKKKYMHFWSQLDAAQALVSYHKQTATPSPIMLSRLLLAPMKNTFKEHGNPRSLRIKAHAYVLMPPSVGRLKQAININAGLYQHCTHASILPGTPQCIV